MNNGALCAGDFTALTANFGEIATVGAAARADCNFEKNVHAILTNPEPKNLNRRLDEAPDRMLPTRKWTQFVPAAAAPAVEKYVKVKGHVEANRNRGFDIAQCVADVTNSAAYIVRVILQLRTAVSSCADPKACAINIMTLGSDVKQSYIAAFCSYQHVPPSGLNVCRHMLPLNQTSTTQSARFQLHRPGTSSAPSRGSLSSRPLRCLTASWVWTRRLCALLTSPLLGPFR